MWERQSRLTFQGKGLDLRIGVGPPDVKGRQRRNMARAVPAIRPSGITCPNPERRGMPSKGFFRPTFEGHWPRFHRSSPLDHGHVERNSVLLRLIRTLRWFATFAKIGIPSPAAAFKTLHALLYGILDGMRRAVGAP